jgi:Major Facilitator Superfamily
MGRRRLWLAITAMAAAQAAVYIARPLTSYRLLGLGGDARQVGLVAAAYALLPLILAIPLGRFADRRNPAPLLIVGCATQTLACSMLAIAQSTWAITAANALLGLGHLGLALGIQHLIARESSGSDHDRGFAAFTDPGEAEVENVPLCDLRSELRKWANTTGLPYWLRNGDLDFFAPVWNGLGDGALLISRRPGYRAPNTLDSWETFARTLIVTTSNLYKILYTRGAPLIGNQPTVLSLPWP